MFGHLVPIWATFNEPEQTVWGGWEVGVWPPGKSENMGRDIYTASKNIIMAHAKVYRKVLITHILWFLVQVSKTSCKYLMFQTL